MRHNETTANLLHRVHPAIADFTPYEPGKTIAAIQEQYGLSRVIKLASNENPLGTSAVVQEVIRRHAAYSFRYNQAGTPALSDAIGKHLGISSQCIVAGNGSDELIDLLIRVKARPGKDTVLTFCPCFALYVLQARLCGVTVRQAPLNPDMSFSFSALLEQADETTALCFVTTPDNPSGYSPAVTELEYLARSLPPQCLLVIDEAYMDFVDCVDKYSLLPRLGELDNVIILRTFSKMYGLAGLRLGYAVCPPWLAQAMLTVKPPFSVNHLAEAAGIAALEDTAFFQASKKAVLQGRAVLEKGLTGLGCTVYPSQANFLLFCPPPEGNKSAQTIFELLLQKGIIIRALQSYGLERHLRVSIGNKEENILFLEALKEVL